MGLYVGGKGHPVRFDYAWYGRLPVGMKRSTHLEDGFGYGGDLADETGFGAP